MGWRCFMVEPSEFCRRALRRYGARHDTCPKQGYHNAEAIIDEQFLESITPEGYLGRGELKGQYERDLRWPRVCVCGYTFHPEDHWQVTVDRLFRSSLDHMLYRLRELPPGAIWRATWMEDVDQNPYIGPDGKAYALMMPGGAEWIIYGPSGNGGKWSVEGALPDITVSPSINVNGRYHGYVKGGVITEDVDGRVFPELKRTA